MSRIVYGENYRSDHVRTVLPAMLMLYIETEKKRLAAYMSIPNVIFFHIRRSLLIFFPIGLSRDTYILTSA